MGETSGPPKEGVNKYKYPESLEGSRPTKYNVV